MGGQVVAVFLLLVAAASVAEAVQGYAQPPDCRRTYECAPYTVVHSQKQFEIRSYAKANWMATKSINSTSYTAATDIGFSYLFPYIQGKNAKGLKIEMTAPVFVDIMPSTGPFCNSTFVMYFYLPSKYQSNPPASSEVYRVSLPRKPYAAVRRFGGFMSDATIAVQAAALRKSLKTSRWASAVEASQKACGNGYTVAGYNSPFEYTGRVNEIIFWF